MAGLSAITADLRSMSARGEDSSDMLLSPVGDDAYAESFGNESALCFIVAGEVEFSCNDFLHRRFAAGDFFFVPRFSLVYYTVIEHVDALILPFDLFEIEGACGNYSISRDITPRYNNIDYDFQSLRATDTLMKFVKLLLHYVNEGLWSDRLCLLKQKELLLILQRCYTGDELAQLFYPEFGVDVSFRYKMLEFSHQDLSINELAEKLNMSPRNFSRRFKQEFGESPHQWMMKEKAKHIKLRLAVPGVTIEDVVHEFNFASTSYFYEYCRKQFACSPQKLMHSLRR